MATKIGQYTYRLDNSPSILSFASIVGKKEGEGPLASCFDTVNEDNTFAQNSWEKAESEMQKQAIQLAMHKASITPEQLDCILAGDLLNQCISSTFGLREIGAPYLGIYGACSTMSEGIGLGALLVESGAMTRIGAITSSHFCTAERQYRFPLEYGGQRPPTSQWTVTGSGAVIVGSKVQPPYVRAVSFGCIEDKGIKDAANMGAAMAPAAAATLSRFFADTHTTPRNYDLILTGDLGQVGSDLLYRLMEEEGYDLRGIHDDCGLRIYDQQTQDVHAGGSGCGCCATVLAGQILPQIKSGQLQEVLFVATGALLSTTSTQQGESIPGVAHLVHLSANAEPVRPPAKGGA